MEKLKPCPHCGGKAEFEQFFNPKNFYSVVCTECGCRTDGFKLCKSENTAKENKAANAYVWNRRAAPENKQQWIPVSERLPEPDKMVLCYLTTNSIETGFYDYKQRRWPVIIGRVTHWAPLPQPPKDACKPKGSETP